MTTQGDWSLEGLNEAYRKGYMLGLAGKPSADCPYVGQSVMESAWEAGWHDGGEALRLHRIGNAQLDRKQG